jgi:hypothetical protein
MEHTHSSYVYIVFQMPLTQVKFVPKVYAQIMSLLVGTC